MTTFLIDTDILIDFFKNKSYAVALMKKLKSEGALAISILAVSELCTGWNKKQTEFFLPRLYAICQRKYLTEAIAKERENFDACIRRAEKRFPPSTRLSRQQQS